MRSLESRIDDLERDCPRSDSLPTVTVRFVGARDEPPGELRGIETDGRYIKRRPGESEKALTSRVVAVAKRHRAPGCVIVLLEDRG